MINWADKFEAATDYHEFLNASSNQAHQQRWQHVYDQTQINASQVSVLKTFTRQMNVLCMAGAWCGDCVNQCPILQRIAEVTDTIDLRFVDRDADPEIQKELSICGGARVPVVVFLSEDMAECARYGDRTLSKYRELGTQLLGAACPTGLGGTSPESMNAVVDDWLREFERVQLMLRLSPRLRQKHGD